jgi:hypothetical protein
MLIAAQFINCQKINTMQILIRELIDEEKVVGSEDLRQMSKYPIPHGEHYGFCIPRRSYKLHFCILRKRYRV